MCVVVLHQRKPIYLGDAVFGFVPSKGKPQLYVYTRIHSASICTLNTHTAQSADSRVRNWQKWKQKKLLVMCDQITFFGKISSVVTNGEYMKDVRRPPRSAIFVKTRQEQPCNTFKLSWKIQQKPLSELAE